MLRALTLARAAALLGAGLLFSAVASAAEAGQGGGLRATDAPLLSPPPLVRHYEGFTESEVLYWARMQANHVRLAREMTQQLWFAALVSTATNDPGAIVGRFPSGTSLVDWLQEQDALVEAWAYGEGGERNSRRLTAAELGERRSQEGAPPDFITVTLPDSAGGGAITHRLEFGFGASEVALTAAQAYRRHREIQTVSEEVLGTKDDRGRFNAELQWVALKRAVEAGTLPLRTLPPQPLTRYDPYVAFEFAVDAQSNFREAVAVYRESEVRLRVRDEREVVFLKQRDDLVGRTALGFGHDGLSDRLVPLRNPIAGQAAVELRVEDPYLADPRQWNVLEFGEPELLKQSSLARFSLLNAYLEKQRKARAMKMANIALVAEPVITGLNVGGGLAGLGFPAGSAAQLAYNLITWKLIPGVPDVKGMRELFAILAARDLNPALRTKPERYMTRADIQQLRESARALSDEQIRAYLARISNDDVAGMLRLARMGMIDAKYSDFMNTVTSALKVSGASEQGVLADIFNSPYFSMSGDINLSTLLLAASGKQEWTTLSGVSLQTLADGMGPAGAWLQYFVLSFDVRALVNSLFRLGTPTFAKKELDRPFPYSPRMDELAAYEFRVFGFPVLMFYKRGLVREDLEAYQNDYAYGRLGTKIVEHFPTRSDMDAEIRAGRMLPLGFVRVWGGRQGWKETSLAVFAHRIPTGKHRGKLALVIYGLKAYTEHSELMEREVQRFRQFEAVLREGGIIEQVISVPAGTTTPPEQLEPQLHVGSQAVADRYTPLLAELLELRRLDLRQRWGLATESDTRAQRAALRRSLAARGEEVTGDNPLIAVDRFNSSFVYRRQTHGRESHVQVTLIPGRKEVELGVRDAAEGAAIQALRRQTAEGKGPPVILLNRVVAVDGRQELGPLLRNAQDGAIGAGVIATTNGVERIFALLDRLPVTDQSRLRFNRYAATELELDLRGDGHPERVFLTIEFPPGRVERMVTNQLTGEREWHVFENGRWISASTTDRLIEFEYDAEGSEIRSRTFANRGTLQAPLAGDLIEETSTVELWFRDLGRAGLDPYLPLIAKLRANKVTGHIARETYGLFPQPFEVSDSLYCAGSRFSGQGILTSTILRDNGRAEADFARPELERVLKPLPGKDRFQRVARFAGEPTLAALAATGYRVKVEKTDIVRRLSWSEVFDNARHGRIVEKHWVDDMASSSPGLNLSERLEYREDFHHGLIPFRSSVAVQAGPSLAEVTTLAFDPVSRRLTGIQLDYTGKVSTNTWDPRWDNPVVVDTALRRTVCAFDREATTLYGRTTGQITGEEITTFSGQYDADRRLWTTSLTNWYAPRVARAVEFRRHTGFGRLVSASVEGLSEARVGYGADGREVSRETFGWDAATGKFQIPWRRQDDYRWRAGACDAHVATFLDDRPYDEFRAVTDSEGRTVADGIKSLPGLELRAVTRYHADTSRAEQTDVLQNGTLRARQEVLPALDRAPDGSWIVTVVSFPAWGLARTNTYRVDDPLGRPLETALENGKRSRTLEWFAGSGVAKATESVDARGQTEERWQVQPAAGVLNGIPYDLSTRRRVSLWGESGFIEQRGTVRGTDVVLFSERDGKRTLFDLSAPFDAPAIALDLNRVLGLRVRMGESVQSNVLEVFRTSLHDPSPAATNSTPAERTMQIEGVDLSGAFYHRVTAQTFDRAGNLLHERIGRTGNLGPAQYTVAGLLSRVGEAQFVQAYTTRYDPGQLVQRTNNAAAADVAWFASRPVPQVRVLGQVNDQGWRDFPTSVEAVQLPPPEEISTRKPPGVVFRRLAQPRLLRHNSSLPSLTNVWTSWTTTELDAQGRALFESVRIQDATGEAATVIAQKLDSLGQVAESIAYRLPAPAADAPWAKVVAGPTNRIELPIDRIQDNSRADFLAFYLDAATDAELRLELTDLAGRSVTVSPIGSTTNTAAVTFWPLAAGLTRWSPDDTIPNFGAAVSAPASLVAARKVLVVSVGDLERAGIQTGRLRSAWLTVGQQPPRDLRVSPLHRLVRPETSAPREPGIAFTDALQEHTTGLETLTRIKVVRTRDERRSRKGWKELTRLDGAIVAVTSAKDVPPYFSGTLFVDTSDPEFSRPLYSLGAEDGRFLEYYETANAGNSYVATVAGGFVAPKMDSFRAGVLDDGLSPGVLAYGRDIRVVVPLLKGRGGIQEFFANLHNRYAASVFALGAQELLGAVGADYLSFDPPDWLQRASRASAAEQAQRIQNLPTLASALIHRRELPWLPAAAPAAPPPSALVDSERRAKAQLNSLAAQVGRGSLQRLIPTSPGSSQQAFVDTIEEGALIELAVRLELPAIASDALAFYWETTQGGTEPVHASYDAVTDAPLRRTQYYARPADSPRTAGAQLAIAEAAFRYGFATGDTNAIALATNLVNLTLQDFRVAEAGAGAPAGIAELKPELVKKVHGLTLWPESQVYSARSNARAYLLFRWLTNTVYAPLLTPEWQLRMRDAGRDQARWLTNHILAPAERTGVISKGVLEIQDIHNRTTALATEPWTEAAGWLTVLEAFNAMGVDQERTHHWLENLARVHGVTVDGRWGLDWSVALLRPDAISPELTAGFARVASLLGHSAAAAFARQSVERMREGDAWPQLISKASTAEPFATGQGALIYARPEPPRGDSNTAPAGSGWPVAPGTYAQVLGLAQPVGLAAGTRLSLEPIPEPDVRRFVYAAAAIYLSIILVTLGWWSLRLLRRHPAASKTGSLVSPAVMQMAEERWAKRVLGVREAAGTRHTRFSNGPIEQNFHMQLRATYKLVLEWRRLANGWAEQDRRLVEDANDDWLNGLDEFAAFVGLYSRWVVKAGRKDGLRQPDVLRQSEDSNHLWSRLVMYFCESHAELLELVREFKRAPDDGVACKLSAQIESVLRTTGIRPRIQGFDAREAFDAPANQDALDLLIIQLPNATLEQLVKAMHHKLGIPEEHITLFLRRYEDFKEREYIYPVHPYLLEAAKVLPHFLLMGLVALMVYNSEGAGLPVVPYLIAQARNLLLSGSGFNWSSLAWILPLLGGLALSFTAYALGIYRYRWKIRPSESTGSVLDATVTSFFTKTAKPAESATRTGRWWQPRWYERLGWILRGFGLAWLALLFLRLETPGFVTYMAVKGLLATLLLAEATALVVPMVVTWVSLRLENYVAARPGGPTALRFLNQLNLPATRPVSLLWLSLRYHFQPSVPTGTGGAGLRSILFYLVFSTSFFVIGGYIYTQALKFWFLETYRLEATWALLAGAFLFWTTMYLLRLGLFLLLTTVSAGLVAYPLRVAGALGAICFASLQLFPNPVAALINDHVSRGAWAILLLALTAAMIFEPVVLAWLRRRLGATGRATRQQAEERRKIEELRSDPSRALGVVYMSGDDLSFLKLEPDLLMNRLAILRDRLNSGGLRLLTTLESLPDDSTLRKRFRELYELERRANVTLWHPSQLVVESEVVRSALEASLLLSVPTSAARDRVLATWHLRRWLVTMMSTAGHSQDTAINLVDIALRLAREGLAANTAFYLIQNKYDNSDRNRPAQLAYDQGELGQRDKLVRLLLQVAPGAHAYSVNDWTPFGFKAGGLVGMDLVYEESLRLTNMLVLDRNANVHDLDALMADLRMALADPGVVIVIPGRGTTNTLTPLGQASQALEEGQRALTRGVMLLGGSAGESLGTGWGNIQAIYYRRVQEALCDPTVPKAPVTQRLRRGASLADRFEGLIGFGPHAVGISEDIWGVTQSAHNAIALGIPVKFRASQALWHKVRETWSHAEWFSAFPRWAGGYMQMMLDPVMQLVNDNGPLSVFAKELRANGGRFFLSAPAALISILLMPVSILWEMSPFVKILILLWNFGFVMNQVLTGLGLIASLEATGFSRGAALAGFGAAGALALGVPGLAAFAPALVPLGTLAGGFAMGLGRWFYDRGRDMLLFGPQLVIHALGQVVRQSLEFVLSGASADDAKSVNVAFRAWVGPREDRPLEKYQSLINLRTVVWGVGLLSVVLNLFALSRLDFLNVVLLVPSLLFSVSALLGPFLMQPKPGRHLGQATWAPKVVGWAAGFAFYVVVAWLGAHTDWRRWAALGLFALGFGYLLSRGGRYFGYRWQLGRSIRGLQHVLHRAGLASADASRLANEVVRASDGDPEKARAIFVRKSIAEAYISEAVDVVRLRIGPRLRQPMADRLRGRFADSRWAAECSRSFVLAMFTFIWFAFVPVPGLLAFQAPDGLQLAVPLWALLSSAAGLIVLALGGLLLSRLMEWHALHGPWGRRMDRRIQQQHDHFRGLLGQADRLTPAEIAHVFALFTDIQTYVDQRSYAYARRSLGLVEQLLETASRRRTEQVA